ncbi:MAG TPA: transglutaminase-like domain-containing protein [Tepidisphaeraceae bacterium]
MRILRASMGLWTAALMISGVAIGQAQAADEPVSLNDAITLVPTDYRHQLIQRLSIAEDNQQQWLDTIATAKPEYREALAFLLVNMPDRDLMKLTGDYVMKNVELAYEARSAHPWTASVPKEIFFDDVLPYANVNESREDWRTDFVKRFAPLVKDCETAGDAVQLLNREVFKAVNVKYHATKRLKPNQSPSESMKIGYASCSGLSIILVDACRAVGVPARVVGTPLWYNASGNHTWVEAWDGQWRFIGAAEPGAFNKTWFAENAAKADPSKPENHIFAVSFKRTQTPFVMVWNRGSKEYSAVDETSFYAVRKMLKVSVLDGAGKPVAATVRVSKASSIIAQASNLADDFELAADTDYSVEATLVDGKTVTKKVHLPRDADATVELRESDTAAN